MRMLLGNSCHVIFNVPPLAMVIILFTTLLHVLYALQTLTCCLFLVFTPPLPSLDLADS